MKEGNVLFNDALNTIYLWLYGIGHRLKNHMGYSFQLAAWVPLYAPSHRKKMPSYLATVYVYIIVRCWLYCVLHMIVKYRHDTNILFIFIHSNLAYLVALL